MHWCVFFLRCSLFCLAIDCSDRGQSSLLRQGGMQLQPAINKGTKGNMSKVIDVLTGRHVERRCCSSCKADGEEGTIDVLLGVVMRLIRVSKRAHNVFCVKFL